MSKRPQRSKAKQKAPQGGKAADGNDALAELRGKIDGVDERLQRLIAERAQYASESYEPLSASGPRSP